MVSVLRSRVGGASVRNNELNKQMNEPLGGPICVIVPNFLEIGQADAEIWVFFDYSR